MVKTKHVEATVTNENYICEEIKSGLLLRNACCCL